MFGDAILKKDGLWLKFNQPREVILTGKVGEVRESLRKVEALVEKHGWTAVGFLGYEAAPAFDTALKVLPSHGFPLLWFGLYESFTETARVFQDAQDLPPMDWTPGTPRETYNNAIQTVKERIAQGLTYQVNYTMRLHADFDGDPFTLFTHLARSQNKYAAYIDLGDWAVCSASHELFFNLNGERITSRPMKGTVKRGRTSEEDRIISDWLHASMKNRAENVMIVDMVRNDLGRIAEIGTVSVPELFLIEKYPTLFQMTTTVQAKTKASITEIFAALFPCASITGAPKVSTMNIISDLETSPRNIYCGSIGHIMPNRVARFNVAIRTALVDKKNRIAEYGVGGGIVWDSTSTDEYSEALLKARILTDPPQKEFSLFETLLWTPEEGFFLLERHIARMLDSAKYFGFISEDTNNRWEIIRSTLNQLIEGADSPRRVRLFMNPEGEVSGEAKDFQPGDKAFKVCLATVPVNSNDRFLFHKTTNREVYENAVVSGFDDVLLFNEKNEPTEFTIGNLVVKMNGEYFTPPVECGLLSGTFRAELVASGEVKERVLKIEDLAGCDALFLINSLRKWVNVEMGVFSPTAPGGC